MMPFMFCENAGTDAASQKQSTATPTRVVRKGHEGIISQVPTQIPIAADYKPDFNPQ
jgi:hypothetical protein